MPVFLNQLVDEVVVQFGADVELERCLGQGVDVADELAFHSTSEPCGPDTPLVVLKFSNVSQIDAVIHELTDIRNEMWLAGMLRRLREREAISSPVPPPVENQTR